VISQETIERLGKTLVELHCDYPPEDLAKILEHAYEHRKMDGYPHDLATVLENLATKLRSLEQKPDPLRHWRSP
jgi:hypothetical protein